MGHTESSLEELVVSSKSRKPAFIFDLDGTLVDSAFQIGQCINKARIEKGYPELTSQQVFELVGVPIENFLVDLEIDDKKRADIVLRFRELLKQEVITNNQIFDGVEKFLSLTKQKNYAVGIATSKPTLLSELVVTNSVLRKYVDVVQGTEGFPAKPDPEVIIRCASKLGSKNLVMFGDRAEDMLAARSAGCSAIGIHQTFHGKNELKGAGASLVFSDFHKALESFNLIEALVIAND